MRTPRPVLLWMLTALLLVSATSLFAEVSVRMDRKGGYALTHVIPSGPVAEKQVWTPVAGKGRLVDALNPDGDLLGDLWPTVMESPSKPYHPWVVWSRSVDEGFELAWSTWTPAQSWTPISSVAGPDFLQGDQLDPRVAFDREGRPYLVWWTRADGESQVYVSVFLATRWMAPFLVSDGSEAGSHPSIEIGPQGRMSVQYQTPEGKVTQWVYFHRPITITDDINPQGRMILRSSPYMMLPKGR